MVKKRQLMYQSNIMEQQMKTIGMEYIFQNHERRKEYKKNTIVSGENAYEIKIHFLHT